MKKKSKDTVLTSKARRDIIDKKYGVNNMTKETESFTLQLMRETFHK